MNFEALPAQLREKRERLCRMMARAVPVAGGASGSCSDGLNVFIGVRDRGKVVEVKPWYGTFNFYKEVKVSLAVAALARDLVRLFENPEYVKDLNVDKVVVCIRKKLDPDWTGTMPLNIGKNLIDKYVREHSLNHSRDKWENLDTKQREALKDEIVGLACDFFRVLEEEVAREYSLAGRRREDLGEILPEVQENEIQVLYKEKQDLEAVIREKDAALEAKDAEIIFFKDAALQLIQAIIMEKEAALEAKNAEITFLKLTNDAARQALNAELKARNIVMNDLYAANARAAIGTPFTSGFAEREFLQNKEIKELKVMLSAKDAAIEAQDAALEAKEVEIASLKEARDMAWYTGIGLACQTPCNPSFQSLPEIELFLQGDDWMGETELDNRRSPVCM